MVRLNYKRGLFLVLFATAVIFVFGQNFDLVPENRLLHPLSPQTGLMENANPGMDQRGFIGKYLLKGLRPTSLPSGDFSMPLRNGANNYFQSEEFKNSDLGKLIENLQNKAQTQYSLWSHLAKPTGRNPASLGSTGSADEELSLIANRNYAALKLTSLSMETTCGYSMQNQSVDLLFRSPNSYRSFGMGYDPRVQSSSIKMQMNW